jgi:hypothetical protein
LQKRAAGIDEKEAAMKLRISALAEETKRKALALEQTIATEKAGLAQYKAELEQKDSEIQSNLAFVRAKEP